MERSQEAAQILTRVLESLARVSGKTLSMRTRADLQRACELLAAGDEYDTLLEDLLTAPPPAREYVTQSYERPSTARSNFYGATEDPEFVASVGRRGQARYREE